MLPKDSGPWWLVALLAAALLPPLRAQPSTVLVTDSDASPPPAPAPVLEERPDAVDVERVTDFPLSTTTVQPKVYPGNYLIVAPKVARAGLPYAVSVNLLKAAADEDHIVRIEVRNSRNETIGARVVNSVKPGAPQTVSIENLNKDALFEGEDYKVYARAENIAGRVLFEDERPIEFSPKSLSIFVQTDKAIYKPGDTVFYRVVVVTPDLKPYKGKIGVRVLDPQQNTISQLEQRGLLKGVFAGQLALAAEPPLGDWTVHVQTESGIQFERAFTVDRYVLPKFEVNVRTPSFITVQDDLSVLIDAKYTYGKGVAGKAKVTLELPFNRWHHTLPVLLDEERKAKEKSAEAGQPESSIERTVKLNSMGEATVVFTNEELRARKLVMDYGGSTVRILATVTEDLTDIQRNGTAQIVAYRHDVQLEVEKQGDNFKPGLSYSVVVALKQMDNTPVKANVPRRVEVTTFYDYPFEAEGAAPREEREVRVVEVDAHGAAVLTLRPPAACTSARVEARYDRAGRDNFTAAPIRSALYVDAARSAARAFLQLAVDNEGAVRAGKTVAFSVRATEPLRALVYQVVARGAIVHSQELRAPAAGGGDKAAADRLAATFVATPQMAPSARLVVYAVRAANQEVLVDAMDFRVEGLFRNDVSLSIDKTSAEPGEPVQFAVRADPDSYVGLLAVDQSVLLLKAGNDLSKELVEQDVLDYDTTRGAAPRFWEAEAAGLAPRQWRQRRRRSLWYPWWGVGGRDAASVFENAGLVVLTDAFLYKEPEPIRLYKTLGGNGVLERLILEDRAESAAVRRHFPATFVWTNLSSETGEATYQATVPDTITSWVATAFAISDQSGLGVASNPAKLKVFRPFFIRLNLPYSVKRGEKFALQVLVFNYLESEQDVTVTLKRNNESGFNFLEKDDDGLQKKDKTEKAVNVRFVSVPGGGISKAVYFPIVLTEVGEARLHVSAQAAHAGDALERTLRVEAEGYRVERNQPLLLDLGANGSRTAARTLRLDFPADAVEGSKRARLDLLGDLMGPVLASAERLVRMPFGCGEQNMLHLVPNIVLLHYLRATRRSAPQLEARLLRHVEAGYQRQLTYKRADHSFSAFGAADPAGSTWLTAFVVRAFTQARPYTFVQAELVQAALGFLGAQQLESGGFAERGAVHHKAMQGGAADGGLALTAYVAVALLEAGQPNAAALHHLERQLDAVRGQPYALALLAYALHLADSARKQDAWTMLQELKLEEPDGGAHWAAAGQRRARDTARYFYQARPVDVETSAYALLTYVLRDDLADAVPLVRWLSAQRNALGGFSSTQDTVVALQALAAYAARTYANDALGMTVRVRNGATDLEASIGPANALLLQTFELTQLAEPVQLEANGTGVAFAQVQYGYNRLALRDDAPFFCTKDLKEVRGGNRIQLELCCNYTKPNSRSNMAVAEVDTLSGYRFDNEETGRLTNVKDLQRVELERDDTRMNIYFNPLGDLPVCLSLYSDMVYQVADQKPAQIALFDYYDPEQQLKTTYATRQTRSLEDACAECWPQDAAPGPETPSRAQFAAKAANAGGRARAAAAAALCALGLAARLRA